MSGGQSDRQPQADGRDGDRAQEAPQPVLGVVLFGHGLIMGEMQGHWAPDQADIPPDPLDLISRDARIAVAMSGGVDSSLAAARCVSRGFDVVGITLAMLPRDPEHDRERGCCSLDAVGDARRVAGQLGIRHYAWNLETAFREHVVAGFEAEYVAGRTPNPCLRCNERIKFGVLLEQVRAIGATHVATGHYARLGRRGDRFTLHRSVDALKDQSYTLHRLDQRQLAAAVFPLGSMRDKTAVRDEARKLGLVTAGKPDSQELCFVNGPLEVELRRRLAGRFEPGDIVDRAGSVVGRHGGLPFHTVGQRSRLNLKSHRPDAEPFYVVSMEPKTNRVVVGPRSALGRSSLGAGQWSWISGSAPPCGSAVRVQLRAHGKPAPATLVVAGADRVELGFDPLVSQVAPGQAAVLYDADGGDEVLGGGIIDWAV